MNLAESTVTKRTSRSPLASFEMDARSLSLGLETAVMMSTHLVRVRARARVRGDN